MKKSLSLILAIAMVFSMFASVAFAAEATTTTAPKTTEEKYEALKALKIFEGDENGANLEGDMTRAQLAKIVTLLLHLTEEKTSAYTDVPADHWAAGFIGAASAAKIFDGVDVGKYDPEGKVTLQQLYVVAFRLLGLAESTDEVAGKVDDWAKGEVAAVVKALGLTQADYTKNATRGEFVEVTFSAQPKVVIPGKVSVVEAKATGVKTVTVKFSKPVDDTVAKLALTKGTATVATTTKFSEDKATATLTLTDVKVSEGSYTVTLSGLAAEAVGTATASFTAENEKVAKLSFLNASDKLAKYKNATVFVKAENQYGESATLTGGSYTAYIAGKTSSVVRNETSGNLEIKIDLRGTDYQTEITAIPVNIYLTNSTVSAQKVFKVGTEPYVSKIELGEVKYPTNKTALTSKDDIAEVAITRFDQYGDEIKWDDTYDTDLQKRLLADAIITPYSFDSLTVDKTDNTKLKVKLAKNIEKTGDYTVSVYVGSANDTVVVKAESSKVAAKVELNSYTGTIAEGDGTKYVSFNAYDAAGIKLSADDIVDNAASLTVSVSGAYVASPAGIVDGSGSVIVAADPNVTDNGIVKYGEHKGKIKLAKITSSAKGVVYVNLGIYSANIQTNSQTSIQVQDKRIPETIVLDGSANAAKALEDGTTTVKWYVKDQYGDKLGSTTNTNYKVELTVTGVTYAKVENSTPSTPVTVVSRSFDNSQLGAFNDTKFKFTGVTAGGTAKVTAKLIDTKGTLIADDDSELKKVEASVDVIADSSKLTYAVSAVKDLYAAIDNVSGLKDAVVADKYAHKFGRKLEVTAKDASGNTVAIPGSRIVSASSSNTSVVEAVYSGNNVQVLGNKAGTADIYVVFNKADGNTQDAVVTVNVKADAVVAATITADANKTGVAAGTYNAYELMNNIKVVDNYGVEYTTTAIQPYKQWLGVNYSVSGVQGTGTVTVDNDGKVVITGTVSEFVIKAITSNGKAVSTLVTK